MPGAAGFIRRYRLPTVAAFVTLHTMGGVDPRTNSHTWRIAIVGAGPAGFYAAAALLGQDDVPLEVDLIDRLPTPYGLVRAGVAPDHQSIKNVVRIYERTARHPGFRFFGNVEFGRDVQSHELLERYHQVVYAVGNENDRRLGIPGEQAFGCTPATVFVGWFNAHPDYRQARFDLAARRVAIIGNGNVAVDVARILGRSDTELAGTDIADHALAALRESRVEHIFLLGRRGPLQAAFTPAEIGELTQLESTALTVAPEELALDAASSATLAAARPKDPQRRNYEILRSVSAHPRTASRQIECRFLVSPREVLVDENGRVRGLRLERNELLTTASGRLRAHGTGVYEELSVGWVFVSIGYEGRPLPGVPFDAERGTIANIDGRVVDPQNGTPLPHQFCVGWARSGARGLIASHKGASAEVARTMLADLSAAGAPSTHHDRDALTQLLEARRIRFVTFEDWRHIDAAEVARGASRGAPRVKFAEVAPMIDLVELQRRGW